MAQPRLHLLFWVLLVCTAGFLASLGGCGGGSAVSAPPPPTSKIQHVIVIFQENRTPDNLFQDPVLIQRGADIQNYGVDSTGQKIPLTPSALNVGYDLGHSHAAFLAMYDGGKMDGADKVGAGCPTSRRCTVPPNPWFQYVESSAVQPYFKLAETYTFGDRMFQTNQGPSFPAHQFIISGTSAPSTGSNLFAAENPFGVPNAGADTGCTSPAAEYVHLISPTGDESQTMYPCFDHPTLTDLLDSKAISWR
jgi:phospholipase C